MDDVCMSCVKMSCNGCAHKAFRADAITGIADPLVGLPERVAKLEELERMLRDVLKSLLSPVTYGSVQLLDFTNAIRKYLEEK